MSLERLPGEYDLPAHHPWVSTQAHAFQCSECGGISFPPDGVACPYCEEDDDDDR